METPEQILALAKSNSKSQKEINRLHSIIYAYENALKKKTEKLSMMHQLTRHFINSGKITKADIKEFNNQFYPKNGN